MSLARVGKRALNIAIISSLISYSNILVDVNLIPLLDPSNSNESDVVSDVCI